MRVHEVVPAMGWRGLQEALAAARPGDTVRLHAGGYAGDVTLHLPAGVALEGERGAGLRSSGSGPVLSIQASDCRVTGLRFLPSAAGQVFIHVLNAARVTVSRCRFDGGGKAKAAVLVEHAQAVEVSKCLALHCHSGADEHDVIGTMTFRQSDGLVRGNRCGHGTGHHIVVASSAVTVVGNKCWRGGYSGIAVFPAGESPRIPSKVTAEDNRCHDNREAGISLFSSVGEARRNECWGNGLSGIVAHRDWRSTDRPSKVTAEDNRCHDNREAGINFLSSFGEVRRNECWGNELSGIIAQRDQRSANRPSKVTAEDNRCHDNREAGIVFASSVGEARRNDCWRNGRGGIVAQRGSLSTNRPSKVTVEDNRCHDNREAGINFLSSFGEVRRNECWGNELSGIIAQRDQRSANRPSKVTAEDNRCHDNREAGIVFASSVGEARRNDCWRNGKRGIVAQRDWRSTNRPSKVTVEDNRCHDNREAGINFLSSFGEVRRNECWGNELSGIIAERDQRSANRPSKVTAEDNRCHDNGESGIVFFSSVGDARRNDCWRNGRGGIVAQRGSLSTNRPSKVTAEDNRCHANRGSGIAFISSRGTAQGNNCWANGGNYVAREGASSVRVTDHREEPDDVVSIDRRLHATHPLSGWLIAPGSSKQEPRRILALADHVLTGCTGCFHRFWRGGRAAASGAAGKSRATAGSAGGLRVFEVQGAQKDGDGGAQITGRATPLRDINAALTDRWSEFHRRGESVQGRRTPWKRLKVWWKGDDRLHASIQAPKRTLALVSADEAGLEDWLRVRETVGEAKVRRLEAAWGKAAASEQGFLEACLWDAKAQGWRQSWLERAKALALAPAWPAASRVLLCAVLLTLLSLVISDWPGIAEPGTLLGNWFKNWLGKVEKGKLWVEAVCALVLFTLVVWNPLLPPVARLSRRSLVEMIGSWVGGPVAIVHQLVPNWLWHSEASRRFWLRRKLYGYRPWVRKPQPVIVVVGGLDAPSEREAQDLRTIMDVAPAEQAVFLILQMPGLSMLVNGYLDVWFSDGEKERRDYPGAVVHDPASVSIVADRNPGGTAQDAQRSSLDRLQKLLGWSDDEVAKTKEAHTLSVLDSWDIGEVLPALVLGSTPHGSMQVSRKNGQYRQYVESLDASLKPYLDVALALDRGKISAREYEGSRVESLDGYAGKGQGLRLIHAKQVDWIGRVGARVELAHAIRDWYREQGVDPQDPDAGNTYLAELIACGILYHLTHAREKKLSADTALHLESALFLLREQQALAPAVLSEKLPCIDEAWQAVIKHLTEPDAKRMEDIGNPPVVACASLCIPLFQAALLLEEKARGPAEAMSASLKDAILEPRFETPGTMAATPSSAWNGFLSEVSVFLGQVLACCDAHTAERLLDAKLKQDWHGLPEAFAVALREQLPALGPRYVECMARQARSAEDLYGWLVRLAARPALGVYGLAALASAQVRLRLRTGAIDEAEALRELGLVAEVALTLREAISGPGDAADSSPADRWKPAHCPQEGPALEAAQALVANPDLVERVRSQFAAAAGKRQAIEQHIGGLPQEVEGIPLGIHGRLGRISGMAYGIGAGSERTGSKQVTSVVLR